MNQFAASPIFDFAEYLDGYREPYIFGVGIDGTVICCAARTEESWRLKNVGGASFVKTEFNEPTEYIIVTWDGSEITSTTISNEHVVVHFVQPHPEGYLLASANGLWRPEGVENNVMITDTSGTVLRRAVFGNGISDIRTAPNGTIWVGYSDEGIFGNFGWGGPGPDPIGAKGLVKFRPDGGKDWEFDYSAAGGSFMDDVYAMNVAEEEDVWIYYYSNFPVVNIRNGDYRVWNYGTGGATAISVDGDRVLLVGSDNSRNIVRILNLNSDGTATVEREQELVDERGKLLSSDACYGVGKRLYAFRGSEVLMVDEW